jgi:hypothetical protein
MGGHTRRKRRAAAVDPPMDEIGECIRPTNAACNLFASELDMVLCGC